MIGRELLARLTYGHGVAAAVLSMCVVLLLFTGSFTAVSIGFRRLLLFYLYYKFFDDE
jgi:hypothetical protein